MMKKVIIFLLVLTAFFIYCTDQWALSALQMAVDNFKAGKKDVALDLFLQAFEKDHSILQYDDGGVLAYALEVLTIYHKAKIKAATQNKEFNKLKKQLKNFMEQSEKLKKSLKKSESAFEDALNLKDKEIKKLQKEVDDLKDQLEEAKDQIQELQDQLSEEIHLKRVWRARARRLGYHD